MEVFEIIVDANIEKIVEQFMDQYNLHKLLLFGSYAKGKSTKRSDIDLCVVAETDNKRSLLTDMYVNIESDKPFDILLYTPSEWDSCKEDHTSFAYIISKEGVVIYG